MTKHKMNKNNDGVLIILAMTLGLTFVVYEIGFLVYSFWLLIP